MAQHRAPSEAKASVLLHRNRIRWVWLSGCPETGERVVVKTPAERTSEAIEEFNRLAVRELYLSSPLPRSAAVRIVQYTPSRRPWLKMEWGGTGWDEAVAAATAVERLRLLTSLAESLTVIHERGVVHGDIKPANVYVRRNSCDSEQVAAQVRLADFAYGCRTDDPGDTPLGLGTIGYMAPETIQRGDCTVQADLFSLGVVTWETLTGRHPFIVSSHDDPLHVCSRTIEETPPPRAALQGVIDREGSDMITALLHPDHRQRPASADEVARVLQMACAASNETAAVNPA